MMIETGERAAAFGVNVFFKIKWVEEGKKWIERKEKEWKKNG